MANRFWVGGNATWDATAGSKWSATSGGTGNQAIPGVGDTAVFDGGSGAAVVSVASSIGGTNTLVGITLTGTGGFAGTLDFSSGNPTITLTSPNAFSITGTGTRTVNLGSSTFIFPAGGGTCWDATVVTGLTFPPNTATLSFTGTGASGIQNFIGGGLSYGTVSVVGRANSTAVNINSNNTFANFNVTGPVTLNFAAVSANTITNAVTWTGTPSAMIYVGPNTFNVNTAQVTLSSAGSTASWATFRDMVFVTNGITASSSFDLGGNTFPSGGITAPSTGGGGGVIGS